MNGSVLHRKVITLQAQMLKKYLNVMIGNDVYPIDNYKEKYNKPDIVEKILSGKK